MQKLIFKTKQELGKAAAKEAANQIKRAIETKDSANIILATGASQFEILAELVKVEDIDWSTVTMFHLDEYIGLVPDHPASFRKYLKDRFLDKVATLKAAHFVNGDADDPQAECHRLDHIITDHPIDLALVGIGENGHLAFNDPPANFDTDHSYIIVNLDERCRKQQLAEGWFDRLKDVPTRAISMSIRQIIKSSCIIASVPDRRKGSQTGRLRDRRLVQARLFCELKEKGTGYFFAPCDGSAVGMRWRSASPQRMRGAAKK